MKQNLQMFEIFLNIHLKYLNRDNGDLAVKQHLQMGISVESGRQILKFTPNGIVNKRKCEMYLLIFDKNALVKK